MTLIPGTPKLSIMNPVLSGVIRDSNIPQIRVYQAHHEPGYKLKPLPIKCYFEVVLLALLLVYERQG